MIFSNFTDEEMGFQRFSNLPKDQQPVNARTNTEVGLDNS